MVGQLPTQQPTLTGQEKIVAYQNGLPVSLQVSQIVDLTNASSILNFIGPYDDAANLTPSSTPGTTYLALYVGGAGSVTVITPSGQTLTYSDCYAGQVIQPGSFNVLDPSTTATNIVGMRRVLPAISPVPTQAPVPISPSDGNIVGGPAKAISCNGAGNLVIRTVSGSTATFYNAPAGLLLNLYTAAVKAATTATNILGIY